MNNIFKNASSYWVKYNKYEWRTDKDNVLFLTPADGSELKMYNPMVNYKDMILEALNVGIACMNKDTDKEELKNKILDFVQHYGLIGFMTALPTTPDFITYNDVYLPKNHYIKKERLSTKEFLSCFFPFEEIDFVKKKTGIKLERNGCFNGCTDTDIKECTTGGSYEFSERVCRKI